MWYSATGPMVFYKWWWYALFGKQSGDYKVISSSMSIKIWRSIKTRTSFTQISTIKYGLDFPQATMSNVGSLSLECVDKHFGIHISLLTHNLLKTQKVSNLHGASMLSQPRYVVEFMIQSDHGHFHRKRFWSSTNPTSRNNTSFRRISSKSSGSARV